MKFPINRNKSKSAATLLALPFVIASCGTTTTPGSGAGSVVNSADVFAGCTTSLLRNCNPAVVQGVVAKFEADETTGNLTIRFFNVSDLDGDSGTYSDGSRTVSLTFDGDDFVGDRGETGTRLFVQQASGIFDAEWIDDETFTSLSGIVGYQTDGSVIPTEGTALYLGEADLQRLNGSDGFGRSLLYVDFESGTANLAAGFDVAEDFDNIEVNGMLIDGYTFAGREVEFFMGETSVPLADVVGADGNSSAAGMFFGPLNPDENPTEFGAVAIAAGDDDLIFVRALGSTDDGV